MNQYVKPELELDLFKDTDVIICSDEDDNIDENWYRPEYDDE